MSFKNPWFDKTYLYMYTVKTNKNEYLKKKK